MDKDFNFSVGRSREALKRIHGILDPFFVEGGDGFYSPSLVGGGKRTIDLINDGLYLTYKKVAECVDFQRICSGQSVLA